MPISWNSGVDRKLDMYAAGSQGGGPFFGGMVSVRFEATAAVLEDEKIRKHIVDATE